ncbi:putative ATP-dependent RNA helicase TDRD12 isoform X2 [Cataglyphis hispanica]|nr:putative ATP-dependent RNA helicase TDRD12 isoform X2 [Cataglyphis hispanica]XP_050453769.1 putative ATP-dependent RNA helicase TDRD12 isoform X2 [Cataglyphis hispanica]
MVKSLNHEDIPTTIIAIKVTNIRNPYIIRIYEIKQYPEKLDRIQRKLLSFMKTEDYLKGKHNAENPKVGDTVLIQSSQCTSEIELPSFVCRGLITRIKKESEILYYILLVDHGTSIELTKDMFCVVPHDFIPEKYLTKTIGVYNILPICMKKNISSDLASSNSAAIVEQEWSEEAIQFAKDLLYESKVVYFDHLITDEKNGREYGELYLTFDNIDIVSLSKALTINYYAIYMKGDLLKLVENHTHSKENIKDHIIHIKFPHNNKDRKNGNNAIQLVNHGQNNYPLKELYLSEKVLIQSTIFCGILSDVRDLRYPQRIHEGWNEYIKSSRPRKFQSYIWPAINNGLNVVAIGSSQCGKTSGCVMAICGLVTMRQNEVSYNATHPLALILCSSSIDVINVHSMCMSLLHPFDNINAVRAFNGATFRSVAASIYKGCQILVATPRFLARFLNENKNLLSFDDLCYLVLDDADTILNNYYDSIGELFKKHKIIKNREPQYNRLLQIIITATNWTHEIKKFTLTMHNPYICITTFLEAIIFKSIRPQMYILKSICKNQKISDIIKDDYTTLKTMIVCINAKEAEELNAFLLSTKKTLLIHEKMKSSDIQALQENWKACVRGLYPVLICTDAVLSDLDFTNFEWLIHHSVQLKLKNLFNYRFSVLLDNLTQDTTNCKFSIFIDENNDLQFPSLIRMMQRMKVVISPVLLDKSEQIAITLEKDKKGHAICDNVKSFGFCHEKNVCTFRHYVLPKIDAPITDIQINDKVMLMLTYVHNPSHFSARIIEHMPQSNQSKKIKFIDTEYMKITFKIQEYYKNVENRKVCISTNIGDICGLLDSIDTFKRVQIMRIRNDKDISEDKIKFVDVRCIDSGIIYDEIDVCKLMHIPEELSNLPTHIVEIFLAGIEPHDKEYMWNDYTNEAVHEWYSKNFDERSYIIGKVCLHLGNTIWLDDLQIGTKLLNYSDMIGSSLKKELLDKNFAILNDNHIPDLFKLCKNSGLIETNGHDINVIFK